VQSYQPTLEALNQVDADALTFETCSSGTGDLGPIGRIVTDKKVVVGVTTTTLCRSSGRTRSPTSSARR
jgi:hypothetical protein